MVMDERERLHPVFLDDVEKSAAAAERWQDHNDPATRRTEGTLVQISVEHTGKESADEKTWKIGFAEQLTQEMRRRGLARPLFDEPVLEKSQVDCWRNKPVLEKDQLEHWERPPAWTRPSKK